LALCVRLVSLLLAGDWDDPLAGEPAEEVRIAQGIAKGLGFVTPFRDMDSPTGPFHPSAHSPPGYPYLLAGILRLAGPSPGDGRTPYRAALLLNVAVGAAAAAVVALVAGATQGRKALWCVGLLTTFWPTLVRQSGFLWDTPFAMLAVASALCVATSAELSQTPGRSLLIGGSWGLLTLFSPNVAPLLLASLILYAFRGADPRRGIRLLAYAGAAWLLCLAPWLLRSIWVFGRLVPIRHNFGLELWMGNLPDSDGTTLSACRYHPMDHPAERALINALGDDEYMKLKSSQASGLILTAPWDFLRRSGQRVSLFWLSDTRRPTVFLGIRWPMVGGVNAAKGLLNGSLIIGALLGSVVWRSSAGRYAAWFGLLVLPLPYYLTHVSSSYRVIVDPILCLLFGIFTAWALTSSSLRGFLRGSLRSIGRMKRPHQAW